jgi:glycine/D-amino acid oxidase-like deaminating enzyme
MAATTSGAAVPYWLEQTAQRPFPPLAADLSTEVVVIGGGVAGLSVAYALATRGVGVVVLEDGAIASGETGRSSAHLMSHMDDRFTRLAYLHGAEGVRRATASHVAAVDRIEEIVRAEHMDCGFRRVDGYLLGADSGDAEADARAVRQELDAALQAGLPGVHAVAHPPVPGLATGAAAAAAYCAPRQGKLDPVRYCNALADAAARHGARIYTSTRATQWAGSTHGDATVDVAGGYHVRAHAIVVATNTPEQNRLAVHAKMAAQRYARADRHAGRQAGRRGAPLPHLRLSWASEHTRPS